ncbi:S9 family peptidase [Coxiella burnetii]|uniref:S9 family peptidase n=1 Tax=Coxiella burnetii TaxID=777 RepID=UPI0000DAEC9B|nr:prolyl oligopeptidase family serine peptidase [Coxiella burnetii]ABX77786.1 peptidase catalytic domain protein of S9A/B/C families [Coxiella burnetii RSA 331]ATN82553.1 peptidase [Coxiella burnetii]ATN84457.1 peptidase [Coxiella burnetii]POZ76709.1 S9 family peptidase [Coxiella burnetii]
MKQQTSSYGTWRSPISAETAAASSRVLMDVECHDNDIYWLERRPEESGRQVVLRLSSGGDIHPVTPGGVNVRTRVHEYGGGDYRVHRKTIFFANDADQRWYRCTPGENPQPLTPEPSEPRGLRYADAVITPDGQWLIAVRESHGQVVDNELVAIPTDASQRVKVLVQGYHFYAAPRLNPSGTKMAWFCWNQPQMPWDGTELWMADLTTTLELTNAHKISGGVGEFVSQPQFSPEGTLYFLSDKSGFGNLYCYEDGKVKSMCPLNAECDSPPWVFKLKTYDFLDKNRLAVIVNHKGKQTLGVIEDGRYTAFDLPFTSFVPTLAVQRDQVIFIGAAPDRFPAVVCYDSKNKRTEILYESVPLTIDKKYLSYPEAIEFPTDEGKTAYGFYYPPCNGDYQPPENEKPPLIVISHGGPTSSTSTALNLKNQFWTSCGFAVLDVNYGGSTGYGKAYRERLKGRWGVVDVADCVNGAKYLVKIGKADPKRLIIRGGSAGGFTVFSALIFYDVFAAGSSYFGVADLESFASDTHKFESHYLETLVGKYPEQKSLYDARSPINHADRLSCPIIFLQGLEDKVVLPAQAEVMIAKMKQKGLPYAYVVFEHEQHGFRNAKNIKTALESELYFFGKLFNFEPSESCRP